MKHMKGALVVMPMHFNASHAAKEAGYAENSARQQGPKLLTNDDNSAAAATAEWPRVRENIFKEQG